MTNIKGISALSRELLALQRVATLDSKSGSKIDVPSTPESKRFDEAVHVDIDAGAGKAREASQPVREAQISQTLSEEAAALLALDIRQQLKGETLSFSGGSERAVLDLFT